MANLLSLTACARTVGIGRRTLYRYVKQGCPHTERAGNLRANPDAVRRWMAEHGHTPGRGDRSMQVPAGSASTDSTQDVASLLSDAQAELDGAAGAPRRRPSGDEVAEALAIAGLEEVIRTGERPLTPDEAGRIKAWYAVARAKKEHELAEQQRLKTEREAERLVDREETQAAWVQMVTEARARLLSIGPQISGDVCREGIEPWEVEEIIDRAIRRALDELSEE